MIYLTLLTGPYSPDFDLPGKGANGAEEMVDREDRVNVTCELVEEIIRAIMNKPIAKDESESG